MFRRVIARLVLIIEKQNMLKDKGAVGKREFRKPWIWVLSFSRH